MSLQYPEITGTIKDGVLCMHTIPEELRDLLQDSTYEDPAFFEMPDNLTISFTVRYNPRTNSCDLIEDSIKIIDNVGNGESIDGWQEIGGEGGVWFSPEEMITFNACTDIVNKDSASYVNVMINGPSGYGKTARGYAWAKHVGMEAVRLNIALLRTEDAVFGVAGVTGANGSSQTNFNPTEAALAIEKGNVIIILDEINRAHPNVLNGMFQLLDDDRRVVLNTPDPEGNIEIKVGPKTLFISTANVGHEFTGTYEMDSALRKRFGAFLTVSAPPMEAEVKTLMQRINLERNDAETIILTLDSLRKIKEFTEADIDITTRKAIQIGELAKVGLSLIDSFKISLINSAPVEIKKDVTDRVRSMLGV